MNFFDKVYYVCEKIPYGKVASYGQLAIMIGCPRMARQVGWALNKTQDGGRIPAHRVVNREGMLSGAGAFSMDGEQENLLRGEGIQVISGKVDMKRYCWKPDEMELMEISNYISSSQDS